MVEFFLLNKLKNTAVYEYYPEKDRNKQGGVIYLDIVSGDITLEKIAEIDWEYTVTADMIEEMKKAINQNGLFFEAGELPEEEHIYCYASHVINKIEELFKKGIVPERGTVIWY